MVGIALAQSFVSPKTLEQKYQDLLQHFFFFSCFTLAQILDIIILLLLSYTCLYLDFKF